MNAITTYLDLGTYSEWDEEKKLDFLTRELKGKRPLVPPTIEVRMQILTDENISIFHVQACPLACAIGAFEYGRF